MTTRLTWTDSGQTATIDCQINKYFVPSEREQIKVFFDAKRKQNIQTLIFLKKIFTNFHMKLHDKCNLTRLIFFNLNSILRTSEKELHHL